ncbi:hypothetical protein BH10CHL1_BH10CHL1_39240 [soil metagenome]
MRKKSVTPEPWLTWPYTSAHHQPKASTSGVSSCHLACMFQIDASLNVPMVRCMCNQPDANWSDEILLQAVTKKDSRAFELLYDRHAAFVYNLLVCIVRNEGMAEELLQETFWQVWQKAGQYSGIGAGVAWIQQIARHKALDHLRGQKARPAILANDFDALEWALRYEPSAESEFEQNWTCQQVRQALEHVPCEQRLCLELAYFEGLSHQEIAEQTNTPLGTIKTRIRLGMKKLERELLGRGYMYPLAEQRPLGAPGGN